MKVYRIENFEYYLPSATKRKVEPIFHIADYDEHYWKKKREELLAKYKQGKITQEQLKGNIFDGRI